MLAKKYRLPIQEFYIKSTGDKQRSNLQTVKKNSFFIVTLKNSKFSYSRFGVSVGVKVYKLAVRRNFLRRKIYNSVTPWVFEIKPSKDVMITVLPKAKDLDFKLLNKELVQLLF